MALWMDLRRDAKVIIDVGANTSVHFPLARTLNPTAGIPYLEPLPESCSRPPRNPALSGLKVNVHAVALCGREGCSVTMTRWQIDVVDEKESVVVQRSAPDAWTICSEKAASTTWTSFKIGVNCHEPAVLPGLGNHLACNRPALLPEVSTPAAASALTPLLADLDCAILDVDDVGPPRRTPHFRPSKRWDLLLLPVEARDLCARGASRGGGPR